MQSNHELMATLLDDLGSFSRNPLGWVIYAFEWGQGELEAFKGPDLWQQDILVALGRGIINVNEAVRIAIASGHGIGKSSLVAWIILWAISTYPDARGVVTANTENQLRTKTWAELAKWHGLFIGRDLFELTATSIFSKEPGHEKTWRIDMIPWSVHNTEAFAGLHNHGKRILVIFDEASAIEDRIWDVTEGALTDQNTEILWLACGNPTRNHGRFWECFNKFRHRWMTRQIDSRTVSITNKAQLQNWIDDWGEDSYFSRVRIRGEFPINSERQFISSEIIELARNRTLQADEYEFAPVLLGIDPSWSGDDETVICMRQGNFSKILGVYKKVQDDWQMASYLKAFADEYRTKHVFIDFGYGQGIFSCGKQMGCDSWKLVNFGESSKDKACANKRAELYSRMKKWLKDGGAIADPETARELAYTDFQIRDNGKLQMERKEDMKKRGIASPNRVDALALTFAEKQVDYGDIAAGLAEANNSLRRESPWAALGPNFGYF